MQCVRCGSLNRADNDYCENCGAAFGIRCDTCNHVNGPASRFCGQCGTALAQKGGIGPDASPQRLLRSLSSKGGERKRLTVLFADIRNSTRLIDSLGDPELAMRRLEPVLNLMKEAVHRYDGIVNKIQGDGVMALFGAPRPHEDHAVRGCLAALAMQDSIGRLADPSLQIRVGLHTGEVIVQTIENSIYQTYDAAGANVHIANRLEQMSEEGGILISRDTYVGAKQFVEVVPLGMQAVRGIAAPIEIFKLTGLLNAPASDAFRSGKRLTSLIGRSEQVAALESELARAIKGDGRVVGVVGDAGIGKSRLCFEFAENCRRQGIRVFEARVLAHGRATPFQPVLELLRDILGIRPKDSVEISRRRVIDRFAPIASSEQQLLLLLEFLGLSDPQRPPPKLAPRALKLQLLDLVRTLVHVRPDETPTVVLIEDLHWIDVASEEFIETLADAVVGTATLLVVNFRPGFTAAFMQHTHFRQIVIPPLERTDADRLLREHFGEDPSLGPLTRNIIERAQGNPFFIEELATAIAERGDFEGERGAYRLKHGVDTIPLPATVQAVVAARIDHLEEMAKQVLETAAVIGRLVAMSILRPVAALSNDELLEAISQLRQAELLYDLPPYDQELLAFRHPLIQEVTYATQLRSRLIALHASVAKTIESSDWGKLDEFAGLLAYHYEAAGQTLEAATHLRRAALWIGRTNSSQALAEWKKVRWLLRDQRRDAAVDQLRVLASGRVLGFAWSEGLSADDVKPYAEEALQYAREAGDRKHEALLLGAYGRVFAATGAADDYIGLARQGVAAAAASRDRDVFVACNAQLCQAYLLAGYLRESLVTNDTATAADNERSGEESGVVLGLNASQIFGFDVGQWLRCLRTRTLVLIGQFEAAEACLATALQADPSKIIPVVQYHAHLAAVEMAFHRGNSSMARLHANEVERYASQSGMTYLFTAGRLCRALASSTEGDFSSASSDLYEALTTARKSKTGLEIEARLLAYLAHVLDLLGDKTRAAQVVSEAVEVARRRTDRVAELHAHIVAADLASAGGAINPELREAHLEEAKALLDVTGAEIFAPRLHDLRRGEEKIAN